MDQKKILIIDDEEFFRDIFGTKLRAEGFAVDTTADAPAGIAKIASWHPDLVLMDVQMPGMTGVSALLKIKEDPEMKNTKVMFLTNLGGSVEEARSIDDKYAKETGAEGYIKKTEDLDTIVHRIREVIA